MALTPEQIAELERLKAMMRQPAADAQRKAQAAWNAEQMANKKAGGGEVSQDAMRLALMNKGGGLEKFLKDSQVKERMYHGTQKDFGSFSPNRRGTFVTPDPEFASNWAKEYGDGNEGEGANVMPVHVQVTNPFDYENEHHLKNIRYLAHKHLGKSHRVHRQIDDIVNHQNRWDNSMHVEHPDVQKLIKHAGHDAYYVSENHKKNLAVYDPRKIKSAIGNRGTYDINEADITKASGGSVTHAHHLEIEERPL